MPTNLLRGYLRLHGIPFSSVGFFFFLIWVFEVVRLVKLWGNCSGAVEIRVSEVPVVD